LFEEALNSRLMRILPLLVCPGCGLQLEAAAGAFICSPCSRSFPVIDGVPRLFDVSDTSNKDGVTDRVHAFYERHPFPDYEAFDDLAGLMEKAREGIFARLLDDQIPYGVRVLDCGCGTGQLSNFLSIAHRTVFGTDMAVNSLQLGEDFRNRYQLDRAFFLQMNLFRPVFPAESFDFVICNGVLHHTPNVRGGLETLAGLARPGAFLIIGLYHRFGRLMTDLRRGIFRLAGGQLRFLDPRIRKNQLGSRKEEAWFADQYQNPHESKHTISEVLDWTRELGLTFVKSIPKTCLGSSFSRRERLFEPEPPGGFLERGLAELSQLFVGDREGGFFTVILQKEH
jgi:SAM-dependent methyltransferase